MSGLEQAIMNVSKMTNQCYFLTELFRDDLRIVLKAAIERAQQMAEENKQ